MELRWYVKPSRLVKASSLLMHEATEPKERGAGGTADKDFGDGTARSSKHVDPSVVYSGFLPEETLSSDDECAAEHGKGLPRTPEWEAEQKAIAHSDEHLMTHLPKNDYCEYCQRAKIYSWPARRKAHPGEESPTLFGQSVTLSLIHI